MADRHHLRTARRAAFHLLVAAGVVIGYFFSVRGEVRSNRPIEWDEYGWIAASDSTFRLMFVDGRTGAERWQEGFQVTTYGAINPNFGKLVIGFALYCWGYDLAPPPFFPALRTGSPSWPELTDTQRRELGRAHAPYVIKVRWLMLWVGAACAVAVYFLGRAISGPVLGIVASGAFILTPLVKFMSFRAYTDNILLLMGLLSALATLAFARRWAAAPRARSGWGTAGWIVSIAVLFGATVSTKFSGAAFCAGCALSGAVVWIAGRFRHHRHWRTAAVFAGIGAASVAVFVLLNPQLHESVPGRIAWSVRRWGEVIENQQRVFGPTIALTTVRERLAAVYEHAVLGLGPFARHASAVAVILIAVGFVVACQRMVTGLRGRGDVVGPAFFLVWSLTVVAMVTVWLPLDWPRYYLPLVPIFCLFQALPVESAVSLITARWRARRPGGRTDSEGLGGAI